MKSRDNFSAKVINLSKLQAAYICSRPTCKRFTVAPSITNEMMVQYMGKVAHIHAAAPEGPRYLKSMSVSERKSISNALFLCSTCADLIDKNSGIDFSAETLKSWKNQHRAWVLENLNKSDMQNDSISITSINQSGGINTNTVNIHAPSHQIVDQNKKADKKTFLRSKKIINDDLMHKLIKGLIYNAECQINDHFKLEHILEFYQKPINSFLNSEIELVKVLFTNSIPPLLEFIQANFDQWPYSQTITNFTIQLKPEFLRNTTYRNMNPGDREKWNVLFIELQGYVNMLRNCYDSYIKVIKQQLHI